MSARLNVNINDESKVALERAAEKWFEATLGQVELAAARKQAWTVLYSRPEAKA